MSVGPGFTQPEPRHFREQCFIPAFPSASDLPELIAPLFRGPHSTALTTGLFPGCPGSILRQGNGFEQGLVAFLGQRLPQQVQWADGVRLALAARSVFSSRRSSPCMLSVPPRQLLLPAWPPGTLLVCCWPHWLHLKAALPVLCPRCAACLLCTVQHRRWHETNLLAGQWVVKCLRQSTTVSK